MRYQDFSGYAFIRHKPESMIDSPPIEYVFDKGARNGRRQIHSPYVVHDVRGVCDNDPVHHEFHRALEAQLPGNDPISLHGSHSGIAVMTSAEAAEKISLRL